MESTNGTGVATESVKEQRERRRLEARAELQRRQNHDALITEFQPDAVEIEKQSVPGGARWTLYVIGLLLTATVLWANWAEVDQIVSAQGELITTEPIVVIDSKLTSPLSSISARFGDRVSAGDVLATVDPTFSDSDLNQLKEQQRSLEALIARLDAERNDQPFTVAGHEDNLDWLMQYRLHLERISEFEANMRKFDAQKNALEVQYANLAVEVELNKDAFSLYREFEETIKRLIEQDAKPESDLLSRRLQSGEAKMKVFSANSRKKEVEKSIETVAAERNAFEAQWRAEVAEQLVTASIDLAKTKQEMNKATRSNEFVELKVPEDLPYREFVVFEVAEKSVGSTTQPGEALFKLVPIGVPMEAEVEIQGKDIAKLKAATEQEIASGNLPDGSEVRVKLASFPYQKHGTLDGIVRTISEGSFEKQSPGGGSTGVTTYKARIKIPNPNQLEAVGEQFRLMPGMTATAEIKVGRRKVIEYFLYPLLRYMDRSIREPE